jgi:adenylate cyclase class 2
VSRRGQETEIKLPIVSAAAARGRLRAAGFRAVQTRGFEQNTLYDTRDRALARRGCLLRVRKFKGRCWLTFKSPGAASRSFKVRKETETQLADAAAAHAALEGLGFLPWFRYEKFRTTFVSPRRKGGEVMLDETPIGDFVELEGSRAWIRRTARRLWGAGEAKFIAKNYRQLYLDWCRRKGRRPGDMIFSRARRNSS